MSKNLIPECVGLANFFTKKQKILPTSQYISHSEPAWGRDDTTANCHKAAKLLAGSDVKTTTVIGFPHGYNTTETKKFEAEQDIKNGAVELDMVLNISR